MQTATALPRKVLHAAGPALLIIVAFTLAFLDIGHRDLIADESFHWNQIQHFQHSYEVASNITNVPGYHLIIANLLKFLERESEILARFLSMALGSLSVIFFFLISRRLSPDTAGRRTLEFSFCPIIFPLFFLLYTDMPSMALVLGAYFLLLSGRHGWSGLVGLASLFLRQTNIVWLAFMVVHAYGEHHGFRWSGDSIRRTLSRAWSFIVAGIAFIVFVVLNDGVALGDKTNHPSSAFAMGNILFFLFVFFVLFLPLNLSNGAKVWRLLHRSRWIPIGMLALFMVFYDQSSFGHPYNQIDGFLRNDILGFVMNHPAFRVFFVFAGIYSLLSLWVTPLQAPHQVVLYPFIFLSIAPFLLVEQRYYIPALTFFLLFRKSEGGHLSLAYSGLLTFLLWQGIAAGEFFL